MKKILLATLAVSLACVQAVAFDIKSPDEKLVVSIDRSKSGRVTYMVTLDGDTILKPSPLGFNSNLGAYDRTESITAHDIKPIDETYKLDRIKKSEIDFKANEAVLDLSLIPKTDPTRR